MMIKDDQGNSSMSPQSIRIYFVAQKILHFPGRFGFWLLFCPWFRRSVMTSPRHKTSSFTLRRSPATLEISAPVMILAKHQRRRARLKGSKNISGVLGFDICSFVCSLKWFPETQKINQKQWIDLVGTFAAWRKAFAPIFGGSYKSSLKFNVSDEKKERFQA